MKKFKLLVIVRLVRDELLTESNEVKRCFTTFLILPSPESVEIHSLENNKYTQRSELANLKIQQLLI